MSDQITDQETRYVYRGLSIGPRYNFSSHPHTSTFSHIQNHVLTLLSYSDRRANVPKQSWWTTHHRHRGLRAIVYAAYKMGWHWFNGWWVLTHLFNISSTLLSFKNNSGLGQQDSRSLPWQHSWIHWNLGTTHTTGTGNLTRLKLAPSSQILVQVFRSTFNRA